MLSNVNDSLKKVLEQQHEGDKKQLEIIFSEQPRIMVEAPAGYGKTITMISWLAWQYSSKQIPNPKKVLALTFSVNAALKVKREVAAKLPLLLDLTNNPKLVESKIQVTNYHGFCKMVLRKYGYKISVELKRDVNQMETIDENYVINNKRRFPLLTPTDIELLNKMTEVIGKGEIPGDEDLVKYSSIVSECLLPENCLTYNSILIFTIVLFSHNPEILKFYNAYYPILVIDEYQDTNPLAFLLIQKLVGEKTRLLILGDSIQKIYGFIGAVPEIMNKTVSMFNMSYMELEKNYRFQNNLEMLQLDKLIRNYSRNISYRPKPDEYAMVPMIITNTQKQEAKAIAEKVFEIEFSCPESQIAILHRNRGRNAEAIEEELITKGIRYFYGMFTNEDPKYIQFNKMCQHCLEQECGTARTVSKTSLGKVIRNVENRYKDNTTKEIESLITLLHALQEKVNTDYSDLSAEDKYLLLFDIFENGQLMQSMEYVDAQVILSTIHAAKGLEWDFVFIPDLEYQQFPSYRICKRKNEGQGYCPSYYNIKNQKPCEFPVNIIGAPDISDELSVFYVAITRAKKQVYLSANRKQLSGSGDRIWESNTDLSCIGRLLGIKPKNW